MAAPTAEEDLVLALAGTAERRASHADRAARLARQVDADRLATRLVELRLLGVLGTRAGALLPHASRAGFLRCVEDWLVGQRPAAAIQSAVLRSIRLNLAAGGIDAVSLKGPELASRLFADPGARPCADLDLLVRADRIDDGLAVLARLGYRVREVDATPWRQELHRRVYHASAALPPVELHSRVEWYAGCEFSADVLDRAAANEDATRRLEPADELATLLLIAARDGFAGLRLMADIAAWWDRYGADVAPMVLQAVVVAHPPLARPLATAAAVAERLVGLPARQLLSLEPAGRPRSRLAMRLADPLLHATGPPGAGAELVDLLLSDRRAARRWVRRRLIPPRGQVALTYGLRPHEWPRIAGMSAVHPARMIARSGWALLGAYLREPLTPPGLAAGDGRTWPADRVSMPAADSGRAAASLQLDEARVAVGDPRQDRHAVRLDPGVSSERLAGMADGDDDGARDLASCEHRGHDQRLRQAARADR